MTEAIATHPNTLAQNLTGRNYLSYSAISTYQQCPLRYFFKYVAGLPEDVVSASLVFGGAIHAAVQRHFEELLAGAPLPSLEDLMEAYRAEWEDRKTAGVKFNKGDNETTLADLASRMIQAFQASDMAMTDGTILGVEEEIVGELVPGCPDLLAKLDLVIDTDDAVVITDFKTAKSAWTNEQAEESGTQLLLYSELAKVLVPGKQVRLQFVVLTKTKEPSVEAYPLTVDPQRIARTKRIVERVWQAISAQHFYPSPSPVQCPTCPYRQPCRAWQG
ncbi:MAG: RecB family exonuclease [Pirellulales bacterium]